MNLPANTHRHAASYRDPSGFIFERDGKIYRQVNQFFKDEFLYFINSGCYAHLAEKGQLISHTTINENLTGSDEWFCTLQPQVIPFISYPYEWSFDMLKDAALLTLQLAKEAMSFGMMLKDATPYNVQMLEGGMVFIDTLSFERYDASKPWIAYRQFCESFLAPLALMHYLKQPLQPLMLAYPEGIPLPLVKKMLPWKSKLNLNVGLHVHLHASYATGNKKSATTATAFTAEKLKNILNSLEQTVQSFHLDTPTGIWSNYYDEALQREDYVVPKQQIIEDWLQRFSFSSAVDVGANEGAFSLLLAQRSIFTISADADHYSINTLYHKIQEQGIKNIHPLIADLANPSPAIGVNNEERKSLLERGHGNLVLALAVIHHLAIGKNIPFEVMVTFFKRSGNFLIIEFVPKDDEKIKLMLTGKRDVYHWYTQERFLETFTQHFKILDEQEIASSKRILYLMQVKEN